LDYWKRRLAGAQTRLDLPTDRPRPKAQTFTGERLPFQLSQSLLEELRALCLNAGVTLFMALLAAFKVLLCRYTGQDDIIVGTNVANRTRAEIEGLIGFFVNLLALRTDCSGNPSFTQLLERVREITLGAYTHQELPFEWVVGELQPERDLSYSPLFQVVFSFQNAPSPALELTGLKLSLLDIEIETAKFDLVVNMWENERGLAGSLEYNSDLFDRATAMRMLQDFERLLSSVAAQPDARLDELEILPEEERVLLDQPINTAELDEMFSF
jgi:non-ribosomal peptide synthetase component F